MKLHWTQPTRQGQNLSPSLSSFFCGIERGGGSAALDREPAETTAAAANAAAVPYNGPDNDLRPVQAVLSGELRKTHPIHPSKAATHDHPEPIRPAPPSQSGGLDGPLQTA